MWCQSWKQTLLIGASVIASVAEGHHSFAPHFDSTKSVDLMGVIVDYEQRNPHAYLILDVTDADGRETRWRCESHGYTQLSRNGITPEKLKKGTELRVSGSQHRRSANECFFDRLYFTDGSELSVNGDQIASIGKKVDQRDSIFGVWLLKPANRATSGPQFMMDYLTEEGRAAVNLYDPFTMDPTYRCEPVALRRVWFAPGTPMSVERLGDNVVIRHEWMDVERIIHMSDSSIVEFSTENVDSSAGIKIPNSILGYSRGYWEGDTLVIKTDHYRKGVLNQFVVVEGEPMRGLLHSDALTTEERITFNPEGNSLSMTIAHFDSNFFTRDFPLSEAEYAASDMEIKPFGCKPEQLR
jgi:hypothetical protein